LPEQHETSSANPRLVAKPVKQLPVFSNPLDELTDALLRWDGGPPAKQSLRLVQRAYEHRLIARPPVTVLKWYRKFQFAFEQLD
jgi:hypothetical protein